MTNNHKVVQIFSINVESDQDYQRYASRRKSSVVREISDRIHSVLNREEEDDTDQSVDGVFRFKCQLDVQDVIPSNGQTSVEAHHYERRGSSVLREQSDTLPGKDKQKPIEFRKWFVLVSSFVNMFITGGFPFNMSVLFVEFLQAFGRTKAETSLVQSVCTGFFFIGGLVTGTLVSRFGTRICGCCGALLSAVGIGVCFVAPNLEFLIVFLGAMAGAGFSLNVICASTSVSQNFSQKKKVMFLAIISTGSGVGALSFPLMLQYFTDMFGWRGCLLVISGLVFNQFACGLMSGPSFNTKTSKSLDPYDDHEVKNENKGSQNICFSRFQTLMKNKVFLAYCLSLAFVLTSFNSFLIFFIDYFEQKGFERTSVVWLYSGMNIISSVFRFIPGLMAQSSKLPKLAIPAIFSAGGSVGLALLPLMNSYLFNAIVVACYGAALGGVVTVISITTLDLVGDENYPTGFGMLLAVIGFANTVGAPVSGYFRDISGSYNYGILSGAGSSFLASIILTFAAIYHKQHGEDPMSKFNMEIEVQARRKSRRRSSILPWRRSVDFGFAL
ncbi:monocarboxylate transporter 13-like [Saccostrea echinata]|uniref:monocarboxylate transporter 13-like n=1 Tax=Saccostrea echinata TaxID=191078 RepID=UPI002A839301|nr:monocarboxylate transporter 13-like [Saccostrea echinata]